MLESGTISKEAYENIIKNEDRSIYVPYGDEAIIIKEENLKHFEKFSEMSKNIDDYDFDNISTIIEDFDGGSWINIGCLNSYDSKELHAGLEVTSSVCATRLLENMETYQDRILNAKNAYEEIDLIEKEIALVLLKERLDLFSYEVNSFINNGTNFEWH